ncbi:hypothetical protein [Neosynechococcus sphagnicola]|uniref:hypothetical protein n=1 Tax=Neosynechococcus sphagnicola TaxID=1501145 RepID=UPI00068B689D|nr:hypothetical protein [Neosynechococcus sphagnicola]
MCGNTIGQTVLSPSGQTKAVVFKRDCGATTGFSTQVSVLSSDDELPNDGGNVLVLDGAVPIELRWLSESSLAIGGIGNAKVFLQESVVANTQVSYVR